MVNLSLVGPVPGGGGSGGPVTTDSITDATTVGKSLVKAVDGTAARTAIGAADATALAAKADDSAVVKLAGDQSLAGIKTFSSAPVVPDSSFAFAKVGGLQGALDGKVSTNSTETIAGVKTFSSIPLGPASDPTTANQLARKSYIDNRVNTLVNMAPGASFTVVYDGTNWKYNGATVTSRPTARTDLVMECINPVDTSQPAWAIDGDLLLVVS